MGDTMYHKTNFLVRPIRKTLAVYNDGFKTEVHFWGMGKDGRLVGFILCDDGLDEAESIDPIVEYVEVSE